MKMERGQQRIDRGVSSSFHHVEIWELSLKGKRKKGFCIIIHQEMGKMGKCKKTCAMAFQGLWFDHLTSILASNLLFKIKKESNFGYVCKLEILSCRALNEIFHQLMGIFRGCCSGSSNLWVESKCI